MSPKDATISSQSFEEQAQTRLLLYLWDLGGIEQEVKKGDLNKKLIRGKEKSAKYSSIYDRLEEAGAIALKKKGSSFTVSLTNTGLQMLAEGLQAPEFQFGGNQVGSAVANGLLKWIRSVGDGISVSEEKSPEAAQIESYDEFKQLTLDVYDRLNQDYNLENLVPIYRIRREIGDRITRSNFNEWLRQMQAQGIFLLQGGEMLDITPDKAEDSIKTSLGELRYYATHLNN
ncbi:hypothetical protein [Oscillatoria salina]|uniref:hypothetical protein n=1 Tax=Oscillatoria salina TaxID=331517 RepID=UPI0013B806D2|nr:hypothetical protein [Oscillatoria salina]MBZ8181173.1 hypothetical protein [Oscillatoria salina IIICB1]NET88872.1 hypothetical protein [Kamptonema sp. SIO1D9]